MDVRESYDVRPRADRFYRRQVPGIDRFPDFLIIVEQSPDAVLAESISADRKIQQTRTSPMLMLMLMLMPMPMLMWASSEPVAGRESFFLSLKTVDYRRIQDLHLFLVPVNLTYLERYGWKIRGTVWQKLNAACLWDIPPTEADVQTRLRVHVADVSGEAEAAAEDAGSISPPPTPPPPPDDEQGFC